MIPIVWAAYDNKLFEFKLILLCMRNEREKKPEIDFECKMTNIQTSSQAKLQRLLKEIFDPPPKDGGLGIQLLKSVDWSIGSLLLVTICCSLYSVRIHMYMQ